jgi:hypothetical protein
MTIIMFHLSLLETTSSRLAATHPRLLATAKRKCTRRAKPQRTTARGAQLQSRMGLARERKNPAASGAKKSGSPEWWRGAGDAAPRCRDGPCFLGRKPSSHRDGEGSPD